MNNDYFTRPPQDATRAFESASLAKGIRELMERMEKTGAELSARVARLEKQAAAPNKPLAGSTVHYL